ncbi:MAG: mannitol dehydrogenase family protein [Sphingomonas fennica]
MRLSRATLGSLLPVVVQPVDSGPPSGRIVHLGIGAFHRAHQAIYTTDAGDGWAITGISLRSPQVRDALAPQDGLYTVTERSNGVAATRLVTAIDRILVGPEAPDAVIAAIADPGTHVVTLTVTEKGYYRQPSTGRLDRDDPAVASDLSGGAPRTIYGYLAPALARRRATGAGGLSLVSCDNLSGNGRLLGALLDDYLALTDPSLAEWARDHVACPDTMVDRIVPSSTAADRAAVATSIGLDDAGAIVTEPFRQWVIEDRFAGPRPRWEKAGAQIAADVAPFELAKLRLLNASHSTLAYMGLQLGHATVADAIADPALRAFVSMQMEREAVPSLPDAPALDPAAYIAAILPRFANADLHHRLDQIAMDGSQKLPQRWLATIAERHRRGQASPLHMHSVAAWIAYTAAAPAIASDPFADRYEAIWASAGGDPHEAVRRYLDDLGLFPALLTDQTAAIAAAVQRWRSDPRAALGKATA